MIAFHNTNSHKDFYPSTEPVFMVLNLHRDYIYRRNTAERLNQNDFKTVVILTAELKLICVTSDFLIWDFKEITAKMSHCKWNIYSVTGTFRFCFFGVVWKNYKTYCLSFKFYRMPYTMGMISPTVSNLEHYQYF